MKLITTIAALALVATGSSAAYAQRSRPRGIHGTPFVANKTFGLGLELGDLEGITGKWFLTDSHALDFGIGDAAGDYYINGYGGLYLYADFLWHPLVLTKADAFELPLYIGVGGRFIDTNYCPGPNNACAEVFGIRVPVGISFDFNDVPLDVFLQVVPTLDFFHDYVPHDFFLDFDFTVGIRYWFF